MPKTTFFIVSSMGSKKEIDITEQVKHNDATYSDFILQRDKINAEMTTIAQRWDPDRVINACLTTFVSLMDGQFLNSKVNVFLSSYESVGSLRLRTWNFNLIVLAIYLIMFNVICLLKFKYFFKD